MIANFSAQRLESLKINFLSDVTEQSLIKLARHCRRLRSVHMYGCTSVRNLDKIQEERPTFTLEMWCRLTIRPTVISIIGSSEHYLSIVCHCGVVDCEWRLHSTCKYSTYRTSVILYYLPWTWCDVDKFIQEDERWIVNMGSYKVH